MKFTIAIASLVTLLPLIDAVPIRNSHKRQEVCALNNVAGNSLTITSDSDASGTTRLDLFSDSGFGINAGELAWFQEGQPDAPATFTLVQTEQGATTFILQRETDYNAIAVNNTISGFSAVSSGATEFDIQCNSECNLGAPVDSLVASGCTMEVVTNGSGSGLCLTNTGGTSTTLATLASCDGSQGQQVTIFNAPSQNGSPDSDTDISIDLDPEIDFGSIFGEDDD